MEAACIMPDATTDPEQSQSSKKRFVYSPLLPGQIRLLRVDPESTPSDIRCSIDHYNRERTFGRASADVCYCGSDAIPDTADPYPRHKLHAQCYGGYCALSYHWGDPTPIADISLNGQLIGVAQNLFDFLSMVALCLQDGERLMNDHIDGETYYWIDALCIDQENLDEKTEQVQQMWHIYGNAGLVVSWLGAEDENTMAAFRTLFFVELAALPVVQQTGSFREVVRNMKTPSPEEAAAVARLTHNEYFKRAWIIQEVLNTKHPLLVSGDLSIAMYNLRWFCDKMQEPETEPPIDGSWVWEPGSGRFSTHAERLIFHQRWQENSIFDKTHNTTLRSLLSLFADTHCSDPRDKVFAVLNLPRIRAMDPHGYMKADYSFSREDVFFMVFGFWEMLYHEKPLDLGEEHCLNILQILHEVLEIERSPTDLLLWLREPGRLKRKQEIDVLVLGSGREIDCSGPCFQDLIQNRGVAKEFCSETPNGASTFNSFPLEREWLKGKRAQRSRINYPPARRERSAETASGVAPLTEIPPSSPDQTIRPSVDKGGWSLRRALPVAQRNSAELSEASKIGEDWLEQSVAIHDTRESAVEQLELGRQCGQASSSGSDESDDEEDSPKASSSGSLVEKDDERDLEVRRVREELLAQWVALHEPPESGLNQLAMGWDEDEDEKDSPAHLEWIIPK